MNIQLNGERLQTDERTLDAVLISFGYQDVVVATAINGEFVAEEARKNTQLNEGDQIEVLAPMQGG